MFDCSFWLQIITSDKFIRIYLFQIASMKINIQNKFLQNNNFNSLTTKLNRMPKIKKVISTIANPSFYQHYFKSLSFTNKYYNLQKLKALKDQLFNHSFQKQQKSTIFGDSSVDDMSQHVLKQYQSKLNCLRDEQIKLQNQIKIKFSKLSQQINQQFKSTQRQVKGFQDQLLDDDYQLKKSQIQQNKMQQIFLIQQIQAKKISSLSNQYKKNFLKTRKQYETQYVKNYMLNNIEQLKAQKKVDKLNFDQELSRLIQNQTTSYIPNQLVLKKLTFKTPENKVKDLLLAGVQSNDQNHCIYLKKLIQKMKVRDVMTLMSPDLPYFIKTQSSFAKQWSQFLKRPSPATKFYLNPNPKNLQDIRLTKSQIPMVLNGMTKSKSFYETSYSFMQLNEVNYKYQHQPLYSGLLSNTVQNVYFCDYPFLKQRQMIALNVKLLDLRQLIKKYAYYKQRDNENFSAELLLPKNVVEKKFRHIIKLAKTISLVSEKPSIIICHASVAQVLAEQWKKSNAQYLQFDYSQNDYFLDLDLYKVPQNQVLFMEFIQKLVILDIMISPLIHRYFIRYESFPYSCKNTVGGKQNLTKVFILWKHYHELYTNAVTGKSSKIAKGDFS